MQVAVFHPGTQHSWQTALALQQLGRLAWFATTIFYRPRVWPFSAAEWLPGALGTALDREFQRFRFDRLDSRHVRTFGWHEWAERAARRAGRTRLAEVFDKRGDTVFGRRIGTMSQDPAIALWGYNGCSQVAFEQSRAARKVLDRTTPDLRAINEILDELEARHGDWLNQPGKRYSAADIERDDAEYALADRIVVGSEFAHASVIERGGPALAKKLRLLPYCFDEAHFAHSGARPPDPPSGPVKFLFVGSVSAKKGAHLLIEAISRLPKSEAELTVVGHMHLPAGQLAPFADRFTHIPQVPRSEISRIMSEHHVLVFPSFYEGGGIALYEALASGLALIQTPRASHAVTPETGILLDRLDVDAIEAAMARCISDRAEVDAWRAAAPARAQAFTFARYRDGIEKVIAELEAETA